MGLYMIIQGPSPICICRTCLRKYIRIYICICIYISYVHDDIYVSVHVHISISAWGNPCRTSDARVHTSACAGSYFIGVAVDGRGEHCVWSAQMAHDVNVCAAKERQIDEYLHATTTGRQTSKIEEG